MTKEYIYKLEIYGEEVIWKCVISDDTCMTYEGDTLCETFQLDTSERKPHVIQLDTKAKVFQEVLPLQVENGMPFLKMDGKWVCSNTTDEDRLQANLRKHKRGAYFYVLVGIAMLIFNGLDRRYFHLTDELPIFIVMGIFSITSGVGTMIRLKNELGEMGRKLDWVLRLSDFEK